MWRGVRALPEKQRAASCCATRDFSHAEAAEVIGCSEAAARRQPARSIDEAQEGRDA